MLSSTMGNTADSGRDAPAAILDVDGPLYQADLPLGVGFTRYLFEETAGDALEADIDVSFDADEAYFSGDEWAAMDGALERSGTGEVFDPGALERMYDEWAAYLDGEQPYATTARAITKHWVDGIERMAKSDVERVAEAYIDEIEPDIPRSVNNLIGELRGRGYDVYLASLNPQEVLEPFAETIYGGEFGRENVYGTVVATDGDGRYADHLERSMLRESGKGAVVTDIEQRSSMNGRSLAMGDTPEDLPLFSAASNIALVNPADGFTTDMVHERVADEQEDQPQVFNIRSVGDIVQRLAGADGGREKRIVSVDSIEDFLTLLASDDDWQAALARGAPDGA